MNQAEVLKTAMKHIDRALNELDTVCPYYSNDYEALHRAKKALGQVLEKFANLTTGVVESKALAQPEPYDQTALELCDVCGWKAVIPDEGCLVCARKNQKPVAIVNEGMGGIEWLSKPLPDDTPLYTAPPSIEAAVLAEREACAKVCEQPIDEIQITDDCGEMVYMDALECAEAIRARGKK